MDENDQEAEVAEGDALDDDRFEQKASCLLATPLRYGKMELAARHLPGCFFTLAAVPAGFPGARIVSYRAQLLVSLT